MFLKKKIFDNFFSKDKIFDIKYDSIQDLRCGIIDLCNLLKKDIFLIQIFSKDPLNDQLKNVCNKILNFNNYNIYLIDNIEFLEQIDFLNLRFLNIYTIESRVACGDVKELMKRRTFSLGVDNYFEDVKIEINLIKYDDITISKLKKTYII